MVGGAAGTLSRSEGLENDKISTSDVQTRARAGYHRKLATSVNSGSTNPYQPKLHWGTEKKLCFNYMLANYI